MKKLLLITPSLAHRTLYEHGLGRQYKSDYIAEWPPGASDADAVILDAPEGISADHIKWLNTLSVPAIVLTPEDATSVHRHPGRNVLTYIVRVKQIIEALHKLGADPETP